MIDIKLYERLIESKLRHKETLSRVERLLEKVTQHVQITWYMDILSDLRPYNLLFTDPSSVQIFLWIIKSETQRNIKSVNEQLRDLGLVIID